MVSNHICFWVIFTRPFTTINSAEMCSLIMSLSWIGGWGCYFIFGFLCIVCQAVLMVKFLSWSTTTTSSSSSSSLSPHFTSSHSSFVTSIWTLIHGSCTLLALQNSTLKSSIYHPALLPFLLALKLEEQYTQSASNLSSSSNFLSPASASRWAWANKHCPQSRQAHCPQPCASLLCWWELHAVPQIHITSFGIFRVSPLSCRSTQVPN